MILTNRPLLCFYPNFSIVVCVRKLKMSRFLLILKHSITWLDDASRFANFHLVFSDALSRFIGLYPNLDDYAEGDYFDLLNACFVATKPSHHVFYVGPDEAARIKQLMRMNYETMHLFSMNRVERMRCLVILNEYYRLHIPTSGAKVIVGFARAFRLRKICSWHFSCRTGYTCYNRATDCHIGVQGVYIWVGLELFTCKKVGDTW